MRRRVEREGNILLSKVDQDEMQWDQSGSGRTKCNKTALSIAPKHLSIVPSSCHYIKGLQEPG